MKRSTGGFVWIGLRAGIAVALGVMTTLAVSYVGAVMNSALDFGGYGDGDLYMLRQTNRWWDTVSVISGDESGAEAVARVRAVRNWDEDIIAAVVRAGNARGIWPRDVVLIGWPARCLWGTRGGIEGGTIEGLTEAPEWLQNMRYVRQPLPTRVWWPGMAVDVSLFGGAWLLVLAGPGAWRRWMWWRRGGCRGCGYDVRGVAVCPECGLAVVKTG